MLATHDTRYMANHDTLEQTTSWNWVSGWSQWIKHRCGNRTDSTIHPNRSECMPWGGLQDPLELGVAPDLS
jgi:hypothetical protein